MGLVAPFHVCLFALCLMAPLSGQCQADPVSNDEGPFVGGVFSRPGYDVVVEPDNSTPSSSPDVVFDDDNNSNELVVILNYDHPEWLGKTASVGNSLDRDGIETAVVSAVAERDKEVLDRLLGAESARHLTAAFRLRAALRAPLSIRDPRELLEQYVILTYPTVDAALSAEKTLAQDPAVSYVANNHRIGFSWTPNDNYFGIPLNVSSAGKYQWGMRAMNFPAAWDITLGNAYVGAVDSGLLNGVAPYDLAANFRTQFSTDVAYSATLAFHGTHVLGIIGATANNATGVAGACPNCSVGIVRYTGAITTDAAAGIT